jgi:hypothetical protein
MSKRQVVSFPAGAAAKAADPQSPIPQKLKAERVQEPVATLATELKAERVQEPEALAAGESLRSVVLAELAIHQPRTVTIEISAAKVAITLHGEAVGVPGVTG